MARIRTIKPEFPHSESIGRLSRDARLTFIQIWTVVDDEGRARAASRMLASLLFPYDDDAPGLIEGWLSELDTAGFIIRYEVDGSRYLEVVNWAKHQRIDKPSASKFPPPAAGSKNPREASRNVGDGPGPRTMDLGKEAAAGAAAAGAGQFAGTSDGELRGWLGPVVGTAPLLVDPDLTPIRQLLDDPNITRDDVEVGTRAAVERSRKPLRSWSNLDGWIRRAAADRIAAAQPRGSPANGAGPRHQGPRLAHFSALEIADPFEVQS